MKTMNDSENLTPLLERFKEIWPNAKENGLSPEVIETVREMDRLIRSVYTTKNKKILRSQFNDHDHFLTVAEQVVRTVHHIEMPQEKKGKILLLGYILGNIN